MRKYLLPIFALLVCLVFTACGQQQGQGHEHEQSNTDPGIVTDQKDTLSQKQDELYQAIGNYNAAVTEHNQKAKQYNEGLSDILDLRGLLETVIGTADSLLNGSDLPLDINLKTELSEAREEAAICISEIPDLLDYVDELPESDLYTEDAITEFLNELEVKAENLSKIVIPEIPESAGIRNIYNSLSALIIEYEDSCKALKQVIVPEDSFVISKLKIIDTVTDIEAVTEEHDPNGLLGTEGGYVGCIYFADSRVDKAQIFIQPGKNNVIDIGTVGGGSIEIYQTPEEVEVRCEYLNSFKGSNVKIGSYKTIGTIIVRVSYLLSEVQQEELINQVISNLTTLE